MILIINLFHHSAIDIGRSVEEIKMKSIEILMFLTFLNLSLVKCLSVQTQEPLVNTINVVDKEPFGSIEDEPETSLLEEEKVLQVGGQSEIQSSPQEIKRNDIRNMRLQVLGTMTEKFMSWLFQDQLPKNVVKQRNRRTTTDHSTKRDGQSQGTNIGAPLK